MSNEDKPMTTFQDLRPHRGTLFFKAASRQPSAWRRITSLITSLTAQTTTEVIDISKWNTIKDWTALKNSGVEGVVIRCTMGETGIDEKFTQHWQSALDAGMAVMVYHLFLSHQGGNAQSAHAFKTIQPLVEAAGYLPPIFADVETVNNTDNNSRLNRLNTFLSATRIRYGGEKKQGIYSAPWFANTYLTPVPAWLNDYWHWVAHWTPFTLTRPKGWDAGQTIMHQYGIWDDHSWVDPVVGAAADIDRNRYFGSTSDLRKFVGVVENGNGSDVEERLDQLENAVRVMRHDLNALENAHTTDIMGLLGKINAIGLKQDGMVDDIETVKMELAGILLKLDNMRRSLED